MNSHTNQSNKEKTLLSAWSVDTIDNLKERLSDVMYYNYFYGDGSISDFFDALKDLYSLKSGDVQSYLAHVAKTTGIPITAFDNLDMNKLLEIGGEVYAEGAEGFESKKQRPRLATRSVILTGRDMTSNIADKSESSYRNTEISDMER